MRRRSGEDGIAHDRVFLVDWEAFLVGLAGAEDAEAIVEEFGDEVLVRRGVPEGFDEGGAEGWSVRCVERVIEVGMYDAVLFLDRFWISSTDAPRIGWMASVFMFT